MSRFNVAEAFKEFASHVRYFDLPRQRREWLEYRRSGIGGSDAAALLGLDKYQGEYGVYQSKVAPDEVRDETRNESADWGDKLEDVVAKEFAKRTGFRVYHPTAMLRSNLYPFMLATLDRICIDPDHPESPTFLEIKTRNFNDRRNWDDCIPANVNAQVQHYMLVTGVTKCWVAVLIGGQEFRSFFVQRDDSLCAQIVAVETMFWDHVLKQEPPPGDSLMVQEIEHQPSTATAVDLTSEYRELIQRHREITELLKSLDGTKKDIETKIKIALGEHEVGMLDGKTVVTWKSTKRVLLDHDLLKYETPEIMEKFSKTTYVRTFRVVPTDE